MDKERRKIGILFSYSEGWIGGTYYFVNLVSALCLLPDSEKPLIIILSDSKESYNKIVETKYPYLQFLNSSFSYSLVERIINKVSRTLTGNQLIAKGYNEIQLPVLFGYYEQLLRHKCKRKIYWIPDLQDRHYPHYIGETAAKARASIQQKLVETKAELVFSSLDSKADFEHYYPAYKGKSHVVPFAVTLPDYSQHDFYGVSTKYGIKTSYFFSPNQFWAHKNHLTVIKAVDILKKAGKEVKVVFTGNESTGDGSYAKELKRYVKENELGANCIFLGFIDRAEQLVLMKNAVAIIQPSLFEGWSTVVEDAKALNKFILLSNLRVHKEQVTENVEFFQADNATELAEKLEAISSRPPVVKQVEYQTSILQFAKKFLAATQ